MGFHKANSISTVVVFEIEDMLFFSSCSGMFLMTCLLMMIGQDVSMSYFSSKLHAYINWFCQKG